jgi:hypothetical protein
VGGNCRAGLLRTGLAAFYPYATDHLSPTVEGRPQRIASGRGQHHDDPSNSSIAIAGQVVGIFRYAESVTGTDRGSRPASDSIWLKRGRNWSTSPSGPRPAIGAQPSL